MPSAKVKKIQGRIIVNLEESDVELGMSRIQKVFGIVSVSHAVVIASDIDVIEENAIQRVREAKDIKTFKITAKRGDKTFPIKSPDLCARLGEKILAAVDGITVDLHHPDLNLWIEVREQTYMYHEFLPCKRRSAGGLQRQGCAASFRRH